VPADSALRVEVRSSPGAAVRTRPPIERGSGPPTGARPDPVIDLNGRCRGRPSRPRVSRFGARARPDAARESFRTPRRRRSAAPRVGRAAAASVRAIARAGAARAAHAAIADRVRAARARAVPARVDSAPAGRLGTGARGRGPAAATAAPSPGARLPTWVPRPAATGVIARARLAELAAARVAPAADGAGGW
jgi:hypothetical protein